MLLKGNLLFKTEEDSGGSSNVEALCLLFAVGCGDGNTVPIIKSLVVSPDALTLSMGVSGQLKAIGTFSNGQRRDLSSIVIWEVSEAKVAAISSAGLVTPRAVGETTIHARYGSVLVSVNVNISTATLRSLSITPSATTLPLGKAAQLIATGTFSDNSTRDISSSVRWSSKQSDGGGGSLQGGQLKSNAVGAATVSVWAQVKIASSIKCNYNRCGTYRQLQ